MKKKLLIMATLFAIFSSIPMIQAECDATTPGRPCIDCQACCNQGRSVSRECCIQCNGCMMFSDEAKQECSETPF
jgi:hypothetical protein